MCFCFSCSNCCFLLVKRTCCFQNRKHLLKIIFLDTRTTFDRTFTRIDSTIPPKVPCLPEVCQHSEFPLVLSTKKVTSADTAIFLPIAKIFQLEHLRSTCYKEFNSKLTLCFLCFGLTQKCRININVCQVVS